ncbi:MAG: TOBE domain-containing protein [Rhodoferax sp.]|jgi:molybdate transport system regulatory protein|nr:TOBE domain-containing protein [Rhodoferax sp.]MBP9931600.1 TOBE domain-containing protein [Rhodoferax sp.]HQZ08092.1 TOBE domain-containing protein [Burkholderiaceae bacterium]
MNPRNPDLAEVLGHQSTDKRIDILRRLGDGGSISEAARRAGISYKAAWQAIETLSNLAGTPMVEKAVGGSGGGGAVLTAAGQRVLEAATMLDKARADVLALLELGTGGGPSGPGLAAMALRTSMRNQFPCVVKGLRATGSPVRVGLELASGGMLYARITRESAQLLELRRGLQVLALCKATAVRVALQIVPAASRNIVVGTVIRASRSVHGGEVALQLEGGVSLVGFCAQGDKLKVGQLAMASIEETAVVVAISG